MKSFLYLNFYKLIVDGPLMYKYKLVNTMQERLEPIVEMLKQVSEDRSVPRNIQKECKECIEIIKNNKEELSVRINSCTSKLDEVANDANIPMYTRTQIWNIVSMLESTSRE